MKSRKFFRNYNFVVILSLVIILISVQQLIYGQDNKSVQEKNQSQVDVIRVDSSLVTVPATVLDREGRYITNLKKEDFHVFENGIEQEMAVFEAIEQPFTVLLLLDRSGSMSNYMNDLARAANAFVGQLRPDDQIIAATFADNEDILVQVTKIKDLKKGIKIKQHSDDRNTMVYDAVDFALKKMKKIRGRKAIIVFSDGGGSGIFASAKSNLRDAEENEALIYTMQFNTFFKVVPSYLDKKTYYERVEVANKYMRDLAQATGGRNYQIENIADLEKTFGAVAEELRRQYTLGYYPKQLTAGRKQIKVKVSQPNLVVKARDSYVVQPSKNK